MGVRPLENIWLTAADCADRTGLTVRALRVYERCGLICPRRSESNWRLYGSDDIARLAEIIALKQLGFTLKRITELLSGKSANVGRLLEVQNARLAARQEQITRALTVVAAMQSKLATGISLSMDELLKLAKETDMSTAMTDKIAWRRYEQSRPRVEIAGESTIYDEYIGSYQFERGYGLAVERKADHLFIRLTGQSEVEIFPEGPDHFFLKAVPAQIVFRRDEDRSINGLELHQNGEEQFARWVDSSDLAALEDELADRIKSKMPFPGSETLLRKTIEEHQRGDVDLDRMTPPLARAAREQGAMIKADLLRLGALQSVAFKGVSSEGWDVYDVRFENGKLEWSFFLTPDQKFSGMLLRPSL